MKNVLGRVVIALGIVTAGAGWFANAPAVATPATAPNTVQGMVTFASGAPAAGAFVPVRFGEGLFDVADASGAYEISGVDGGFAILDATVNVGGTNYTGTAFVGFAPGGGSTTTANIVVSPQSPFGPFPPLGF